MSMGWPGDLTWYRLLTDWGSIIAGFLALIAGFLAYRAGKLQARVVITAETNADRAAAEAIIREVMECSKLVIEALRICEAIYSEKLLIEKGQAYSIMMNPDPVIYRSVASRISRLPFDAQLIIQFYLRIVYVQQLIQVIVFGPGEDNDLIPIGQAKTIADNLIITCRLAKAILRYAPDTV